MKSALRVALFALAFWFTSSALMRVLPGRGTTLIETKVAWFEEHGAEYDTIFLGSSRCYRGFRPELFDQLTRERGVETTSFNFGTPGSRAFETFRVLDRIEHAEHRLKWVFIDPERLDWLRQDEDMLVRSYIEWHDVPTTWMIFRYVLEQDLTFAEKLDRLLANARSCGYHVANITGTEALVDDLLGKAAVDRTDQTERLGARLDGWLPLSPETAQQREEKNNTFNTPKRQEAYLRKVELLRVAKAEAAPVSEAAVAFFERIADKVESMGAVPIFVIQPGMKWQHDLIDAHSAGRVRHLLRYDDPDLAPELFEPDNRWDQHHLGISGAELFTNMLANDFVELYEALEPRP